MALSTPVLLWSSAMLGIGNPCFGCALKIGLSYDMHGFSISLHSSALLWNATFPSISLWIICIFILLSRNLFACSTKHKTTEVALKHRDLCKKISQAQAINIWKLCIICTHQLQMSIINKFVIVPLRWYALVVFAFWLYGVQGVIYLAFLCVFELFHGLMLCLAYMFAMSLFLCTVSYHHMKHLFYNYLGCQAHGTLFKLWICT